MFSKSASCSMLIDEPFGNERRGAPSDADALALTSCTSSNTTSILIPSPSLFLFLSPRETPSVAVPTAMNAKTRGGGLKDQKRQDEIEKKIDRERERKIERI